jgi:integrase
LRAFLFDFVAWAEESQWTSRIATDRDLEFALMLWMEERHDDGRGPYVGNCVMGALKLLSPRLYGDLIDARALMVDWNRSAKTTHWPPLSLPIVLLLALHQIELGAPSIALAFLVAFSGMLRVSELSALRVQDVVFPEDPRFWGVGVVVLVLQHTKTGDDKSAELRHTWLWPFLRQHVSRCRAQGSGTTRLFPQPPVLRAALKVSLEQLGLEECGFVMHSLRAGSELYLINLGVCLDEVLRRGRWRRPESARPYLQRLRALAAYTVISQMVLQRGARVAAAPGMILAAAGL